MIYTCEVFFFYTINILFSQLFESPYANNYLKSPLQQSWTYLTYVAWELYSPGFVAMLNLTRVDIEQIRPNLMHVNEYLNFFRYLKMKIIDLKFFYCS